MDDSWNNIYWICVCYMYLIVRGPATPQIMEHLDVSHEVAILNISFFILGLGTGGCFIPNQ